MRAIQIQPEFDIALMNLANSIRDMVRFRSSLVRFVLIRATGTSMGCRWLLPTFLSPKGLTGSNLRSCKFTECNL